MKSLSPEFNDSTKILELKTSHWEPFIPTMGRIQLTDGAFNRVFFVWAFRLQIK